MTWKMGKAIGALVKGIGSGLLLFFAILMLFEATTGEIVFRYQSF